MNLLISSPRSQKSYLIKILANIFAILFFSSSTFGQNISSGFYDYDLKLAFDLKTKKLTGYFEAYNGWDEEIQNPKFSCIFFIEGRLTKSKIDVLTFYPDDKQDDLITGTLELVNDSVVILKLAEDHGGCWNIQPLANIPVNFRLNKSANWKEIKYVTAKKAFFHYEASENKKQKGYLVKNDFVCIEKFTGKWAYCTFYGKKVTKGWIKKRDLNQGHSK